MGSNPNEVEVFENSIMNLRGIKSIESGVDSLERVNREALKLSEYAHLPHAALLRTIGGLDSEILFQSEFFIESDLDGINAL